MTTIFVLTLVMLGLSWLINMVCMIIKMNDTYGSETGIHLICMVLHTIKTALMVVFVSILYANIS